MVLTRWEGGFWYTPMASEFLLCRAPPAGAASVAVANCTRFASDIFAAAAAAAAAAAPAPAAPAPAAGHSGHGGLLAGLHSDDEVEKWRLAVLYQGGAFVAVATLLSWRCKMIFDSEVSWLWPWALLLFFAIWIVATHVAAVSTSAAFAAALFAALALLVLPWLHSLTSSPNDSLGNLLLNLAHDTLPANIFNLLGILAFLMTVAVSVLTLVVPTFWAVSLIDRFANPGTWAWLIQQARGITSSSNAIPAWAGAGLLTTAIPALWSSMTTKAFEVSKFAASITDKITVGMTKDKPAYLYCHAHQYARDARDRCRGGPEEGHPHPAGDCDQGDYHRGAPAARADFL